MAPPSTTAAIIFDYRTQVLDNCEFFVGRDDIVSVITVKDGLGNYKAYAIRSNEDSREALLSSESFDTVHKAIESLHTKSSEAVHQYIKTNGFSNPPDLKKAGLCSDEDDDTTSEVTRHSSSSTAAPSEEEWNSSDDEAIMSGNAARNRHGNHKVNIHSFNRKDRKPMVADKPPRRSPSRSSIQTGQDESDDESPLVPGGFGYFRPMRSSPTTYRPPPPPPGWSGVPPTVVRNVPAVPHFQQPLPQPHPHPHPRPPPPHTFANMPRYTQVSAGSGSVRVPCPAPAPAPHLPMPTPPTTTTHTSSASTSPTSSTSTVTASAITAASSSTPFPPSPAQRLYDVRLTIRWLHHGEQRIIEYLRPSLRALQEAALRYVRTHPQSFQATTNSSTTAMTPTSINCLRSCVRQAFFGSESYDMSTYRSDDLSRLFAALSSGGIPSFEIDVDFIGSTGMAQGGGRGEK
ncbi:hypothetical protein F4809DRAFT_637884 [Biscogniauxia mediterranea]|nr:hypothetical protein F4809DRAFT_637884 [Biscogniauxia mediterranea]